MNNLWSNLINLFFGLTSALGTALIFFILFWGVEYTKPNGKKVKFDGILSKKEIN